MAEAADKIGVAKSLAAVNDAVTVGTDTGASCTVVFALNHTSGTWTITFEAYDGAVWYPVMVTPLDNPGTPVLTLANTDGDTLVRIVADGLNKVRARMSAESSAVLTIKPLISDN